LSFIRVLTKNVYTYFILLDFYLPANFTTSPAYLVFESYQVLRLNTQKYNTLSNIYCLFNKSTYFFFIHYNPVSQSLTNIQRVLYFSTTKYNASEKTSTSKSLTVLVLELTTEKLRQVLHILYTSLCSCQSFLSRDIYRRIKTKPVKIPKIKIFLHSTRLSQTCSPTVIQKIILVRV
jgi:hypothetical protein